MNQPLKVSGVNQGYCGFGGKCGGVSATRPNVSPWKKTGRWRPGTCRPICDCTTADLHRDGRFSALSNSAKVVCANHSLTARPGTSFSPLLNASIRREVSSTKN